MPKVLSAAEVARYHRNGFHFPVRVLSAADARSYRDRLEENERALGGPLSGNMRQKPICSSPGPTNSRDTPRSSTPSRT